MKIKLVLFIFILANAPHGLAVEPGHSETSKARHSVATFAAGCFWCLETAFEGMTGVTSVVSGYMGGHLDNPTYEQVSRGISGHAEVVQLTFDPKLVSYELLLRVFWANVDPFTKNAQFCDRGSQYRSGIFFHDDAQALAARRSQSEARARLMAHHDTKKVPPFQVEITNASRFYEAETYHQDYFKKQPQRYKRYRKGCRRDERLTEIWGKSEDGITLQQTTHTPKKQD
ncbi:MAG: peptide-methionine (S)-S-oxide reductase MsrA [Bradymonadia bacterium]